MDDEELVVHMPREGETLKQYLQRYSAEERQRIHQDRSLSIEFNTIVLNTNWPTEEIPLEREEESTQRGLENLWEILERLNNYRRLLHFIEMLEPVRRDLLDSLDKYADEMKSISKWCTVGRIFGVTLDSVGTIGGLCLTESNPDYANWALTVATSCGLFGLATTVTEMKFSAHATEVIVKQIQADQESFSPIHSWYQQSRELEEAMENIFPFDITNKIVKEFTDAAEDRIIDPVSLLTRLCGALEVLQMSQSEIVKTTVDLINFVKSDKAKELCLSLFLRRQHPIYLDIARMIFQLKYSSWPFFVCQSVSALATRDQRGFSVPILGRIGLNLISIHDSICSLRDSKVRTGESEIRKLKRHLNLELVALKQIANFIRLRSRGQIL